MVRSKVMAFKELLCVNFYRSNSGSEPVREWLRNLDSEQRKIIGEDIKLIQFRWPLGMPLVRKLEPDLWEVRSKLQGGIISRVFFTVNGNMMILLHGFIKKSKKTPNKDLALSRSSKNHWISGEEKK